MGMGSLLLCFFCVLLAARTSAVPVQPGTHLAVPGGVLRIDAVVSKEPRQQLHVYGSIGAAVDEAPQDGAGYVVYVARGVYKEHVVVRSPRVTLVGEGMGLTVIEDNRTNRSVDVHSNQETAVLDVQGDYFTARELTVINGAGVDAGPAVAVRSASHRSVFHRCEFDGFQDTLLAESKTQFYKQCHIHGTIDFIWGDATAVFQDCLIFVRKPPLGQHNVVTAQGRDAPERDTGFSFQNCTLTTRDNLTGVETYLGRPWRNHSHVMFMESFLDTILDPKGWVTWKKEDVAAPATRSVKYLEYGNRGPGAVYTGRVRWTGFHHVSHAHEAENYTVDRFIDGNQWLPGRQVAFNPGLYKLMHV
ncbi:unnamed protein product [Alopecurus aequalis]